MAQMRGSEGSGPALPTSPPPVVSRVQLRGVTELFREWDGEEPTADAVVAVAKSSPPQDATAPPPPPAAQVSPSASLLSNGGRSGRGSRSESFHELPQASMSFHEPNDAERRRASARSRWASLRRMRQVARAVCAFQEAAWTLDRGDPANLMTFATSLEQRSCAPGHLTWLRPPTPERRNSSMRRRRSSGEKAIEEVTTALSQRLDRALDTTLDSLALAIQINEAKGAPVGGNGWAALVAESMLRRSHDGGVEGGDAQVLRVRMEGVLLKQPQRLEGIRMGRHYWRRRRFVLDEHATRPLRYYRATDEFDDGLERDSVSRDSRGRGDSLETVDRAADTRERVDSLPPMSTGNQADDVHVVIDLFSVARIELVGGEEIVLHVEAADGVPRIHKLRAPNGGSCEAWFDALVVKLDQLRTAGPPPAARRADATDGATRGDEEAANLDHHVPWYRPPQERLSCAFHVLVFPLKAAIHLSVPNVHRPGGAKWYPLTLLLSVAWLALLAYLMTILLEHVGCALNLSSTVMGLTLGAIGTSFPNLYASILTARAGQGDTAICQAFGSNTFNICIALGLVWLVETLAGQCAFGSYGDPHYAWCNGCFMPTGYAEPHISPHLPASPHISRGVTTAKCPRGTRSHARTRTFASRGGCAISPHLYHISPRLYNISPHLPLP